MRRRRRSTRLPLVVMLVVGWVVFGSAAEPAVAQSSDELYDAAVRSLRRTVVPQRDGSHLARLFALRQLCHPSLEPLFRRLVHDGDWQVQVHAILGLAEIRDPHRIDPWLVTRLGPDAGDTLIANALDMDLVGREQIRELLGWPELPPIARLLLIGELILLDEPVDAADVGALAGSAQFRVAGLASLLLARLGDAAAFSAYTDRLASVPRRERDRYILFVLEAIRQFAVEAALPWVHRLLDDADTSDAVRYWAVFTAVELDPLNGLGRWAEALGEEPTYRDRVRYGLLLLAAGDVPRAAFDRLDAEDDLLHCIAETGRVMDAGQDPADALIALIEVGHLQSTKWAMSVLAELPGAQSKRAYLRMLDTVERNDPGEAERIARAVEAAAHLFEIDPHHLAQRLADTPDDSLTQEVILLGLFEARAATAGELARKVRRIGAGRADSLALLLLARHADALVATDLSTLGRIAAGGGRVSEGLQVQAAWLYLRHTGALDRALSEVLDLESQ